MISLRGQLLSMCLVMTFICSLGISQEVEKGQRELVFEKIESAQPPWFAPQPVRQLGVIKPSYVARFFMSSHYYHNADKVERSYYDGHSGETLNDWLSEKVSEEQQGFLNFPYFYSVEGEDGIRQFYLYAVSEEDARKMTEGFLGYLDNEAQKRLDAEIEQLDTRREWMLEREKEIPQLEIETEKAKGEFDALRSKVYYENGKFAGESVQELNKILDIVEVEIKGIEAKIVMLRQEILRIKREYQVQSTIADKFSQLIIMEVSLNVDLAGALARRETARETRQYALRFQELETRYLQLQNEHAEKMALIAHQRGLIEEGRESLQDLRANLPGTMRSVEVIGNKVMIHPVAK